jgi:hypothetical protein
MIRAYIFDIYRVKKDGKINECSIRVLSLIRLALRIACEGHNTQIPYFLKTSIHHAQDYWKGSAGCGVQGTID